MPHGPYDAGLDVLGLGVGDFAPWLGIVSSVTGGIASLGTDKKAGTSKEDVKAAIEKAVQEKARAEAAKKAEESAARARTITYVVLGVLGVTVLGTAAVLIAKK